MSEQAPASSSEPPKEPEIKVDDSSSEEQAHPTNQLAEISEPDMTPKAAKKSSWIILSLLGVILVLVLIGIGFKINQSETGDDSSSIKVPQDSSEKKLAAQSEIKKFENYEDLKEFLQNNGTENVFYSSDMELSPLRSSMPAPTGMAEKSALDSFSPVSGAAEGSIPGASNDFSKTNVQVEGVDEADIIKSDGKYVYAVANNNLFIVNAYPADNADVLAKIEFKNQPQDIYVSGDRLVIFGYDNDFAASETYKKFIRKSNYTYFKVFDISDRKNPKQIKSLDFEGSYFNSRMIGDYVYFITNTYSSYYDNELPVPRILDDGKEIYSANGDERCDRCPNVYYFDMPYESYNFTNVAAVNIKDVDAEVKNEVYLLSQNQNMYVSENNIYITYTKYVSPQELSLQVRKELLADRLSEKDKQRIEKIESADSMVLSPAEKTRKVLVVLQRVEQSLPADEQANLEKDIVNKLRERYEDISKEMEKTVIHKIAIDKDKIEYKASSQVTGQVLNQFSMDEDKGYFRIATTKNRQWWPGYTDMKVGAQSSPENESYSNLYILDEDLKPVGAVENLAKGERIYSVRFMQDRAYMVTFKQTDPLFVLDLKNPNEPKVLGQLKIPGFSNYLHPYDENTLIGIGKDTKENEFGGVSVNGLKVSLFDVADINNPREINNYKFENGSDSMALNDHKAVLFSKEKNLLVIPITKQPEIQPLVDRPEFGGSVRSSAMKIAPASVRTNGAAVFKVDRGGVSLTGIIDHSDDGLAATRDDYCGYYNCYDNTVRRSLYIDNILYTFSNRYLQMNKLEDLAKIKRLEMKKGQSDEFRVVN